MAMLKVKTISSTEIEPADGVTSVHFVGHMTNRRKGLRRDGSKFLVSLSYLLDDLISKGGFQHSPVRKNANQRAL